MSVLVIVFFGIYRFRETNKQMEHGEFPPIKTFALNVWCLMLAIVNLCRIVLLVCHFPSYCREVYYVANVPLSSTLTLNKILLQNKIL